MKILTFLLLLVSLLVDCHSNINNLNCFYGRTAACQTEREVRGDITENTTWNGCVRICGKVAIKRGTVLNVSPGTMILAASSNLATTLVIEQDAQIIANGSATSPIVFTSGLNVGRRQPGDWGGVTINGKSIHNKEDNTDGSNLDGSIIGIAEGDAGVYGGASNISDNSGVLRYVRIEFAGAQFGDGNELNGLALNAVGSGTTIEHLHLHRNQDDGVEIVGGTVNLKYIIATANGDDQFDWTYGWEGNVQFMLIGALPLGDRSRGIEGDNNLGFNNKRPFSYPFLRNITVALLGEKILPDQEAQEGILLREGTKADVRNVLIVGFEYGIEIRDNESVSNINDGSINASEFSFYGNNRNVHVSSGTISLANTTGTIWNESYVARAILSTPPLNSSKLTLNSLGVDSFIPLNHSPLVDRANAGSLVGGRGSNRATGGAFTGATNFDSAPYNGAFSSTDTAGRNWANWTAYPKN